MSEINRFLKESELNEHVTLQGWQVHIDKAYPSLQKSYQKYLLNNFNQNQMDELNFVNK